MLMGITLSTNRLIIRPMIQYDIPTLSALLKEKKIKTFINLPSDPKEIEAYTLSCESKERKGKMIRWMLALSETEEVI